MLVNFQSCCREPTYMHITMNDSLKLVAIIYKKLDGQLLTPYNGRAARYEHLNENSFMRGNT